MERSIKTGIGWRIGWHPHSQTYHGLVGNDHWAIELTSQELESFCSLLHQLIDTMKLMQTELMDQEKITCEAESKFLWMEVEGYPQAYSLRFILNCDRRCEGYWEDGIAPQILEAFQSLGAY